MTAGFQHASKYPRLCSTEKLDKFVTRVNDYSLHFGVNYPFNNRFYYLYGMIFAVIPLTLTMDLNNQKPRTLVKTLISF